MNMSTASEFLDVLVALQAEIQAEEVTRIANLNMK
jgi:hypothetical protein